MLAQPLAKGADLPVVPGQHQAPAGTAAFLDQAGGGQVGTIEHQPWHKVVQVHRSVRLAQDFPAEQQRSIADADAITQLQPQLAQQAGIGPCRAGRRVQHACAWLSVHTTQGNFTA